jgi:hypothetical protein
VEHIEEGFGATPRPGRHRLIPGRRGSDTGQNDARVGAHTPGCSRT